MDCVNSQGLYFTGKGSFLRRNVKFDSQPDEERFPPAAPGDQFKSVKHSHRGTTLYVDRNLEYKKGRKEHLTGQELNTIPMHPTTGKEMISKEKESWVDFQKRYLARQVHNRLESVAQWNADITKSINAAFAERRQAKQSGASTPSSSIMTASDYFAPIQRVSSDHSSIRRQPTTSLSSSAILEESPSTGLGKEEVGRVAARHTHEKEMYKLSRTGSRYFKEVDKNGERVHQVENMPGLGIINMTETVDILRTLKRTMEKAQAKGNKLGVSDTARRDLETNLDKVNILLTPP
jgi:hypothetical protein